MSDPDLLARVRDVLSGRYEVADVLGIGGMAVVFRAVDPRHGRDVAIKVMRPELGAALADDRFLQEIQITARLQHPHIVSLFDSGTAGGLVYYVMPLIQGESLKTLLQREGRLGIEAAIRITRELAGALGYAHGQGIVHRDIKPANILLSSGQAMLADFGVAGAARRLVGPETLTDEGMVLGTPAYMSPEQSSGGAKVDSRSDIYSLGCVLYEMLVGEPPFTGPTYQAIIARHASERVPSLEIVRADIPPYLISVARKALAKVPADRYQTASDLAAALESRTGPRRRTAWLAAGSALAATIAIYVLGPSEPAVDPNKVVIFPLEERGLDSAERGVGGDVAVMLSTALEHADPLRPLDVRDRLTDAQRNDAGSLSPDLRQAIATRVGAAYYISGVVQAHRDSVTIGLRLYDTRGDSLLDQQSATGDRRRTPTHHLGIDALIGLLPPLLDPGRRIDLEAFRQRNPSAIALFVQGEREYRRSRFPTALDFYGRALAADSSLAIAAIKGALAAYWQDHRATSELASYAVRRDSLLPRRYAAFARGLQAFAEGQADTAEAWLLRALRLAPGWPEAAMQLGEVYYHLIPLRGSLDSLADARFREAVAADSGFGPPLYHLAETSIRIGRLPEAQGLVDRFAATKPVPELAERLGLMLDCVRRWPHGFDWSVSARSRPGVALGAARALAAAGRQLGCAEAAFRSVLAFGPDSLHWGAALGLQSVLAAQGSTGEVVALVDSIVAAGTLQVLMTAYILDAAAGLPVEAQAERVARFGIARWGQEYAGLAESRHLDWLKWLFGVWHARRGDIGTVDALRRMLADSAATFRDPGRHLLGEALAADAQLLAGDTAGAVLALRRLEPRVPNDSLTWSLALPLAVERITLSELLLRRGEYRAAIDVASLFDHPEPLVYVAFLPASLSLRLRAAEALGQTEEASRYRNRLGRLREASPVVRTQ